MTNAPRTRPGQTYPGGKQLRRRLAKLQTRISGQQRGKRPDRIRQSNGDAIAWGRENGFTRPGSMQ